MVEAKKKVTIAFGIFWVGVAIATAITCYGTHAGPKHPNPSIVSIILMLMVGGLIPAFKLAKRKAVVVLQAICVIAFLTVAFALNKEAVGADWPAYTSIVAALFLGVVSAIATGIMELPRS